MRAITFVKGVLKLFRRCQYDELECGIGRIFVGPVTLAAKGIVHVEFEVRVYIVTGWRILEQSVQWNWEE
ncbi:hypothetical protein IAQ61_004215 [Plenodomus lingam]|uniref:uncharacterized protein n=1 Tax=Leptosphaeria maculans TaxID=5022 RepID=UPI00331C72ED|nr:hypothetical protein IAQ61_004215 [Plenodomus lingam]